jgi:hypothetical protein
MRLRISSTPRPVHTTSTVAVSLRTTAMTWITKVVEPVHSAVARYAHSPPLYCSCTSAADTVSKIVHSLDPGTLRVRDEACMHHSFERVQLMALSAQVDGLFSQLSAVQ